MSSVTNFVKVAVKKLSTNKLYSEHDRDSYCEAWRQSGLSTILIMAKLKSVIVGLRIKFVPLRWAGEIGCLLGMKKALINPLYFIV